MNDRKSEDRMRGFELEYQIEEPTEKVWRAISIPEFRESWLPQEDLAAPDAASFTPGEEVVYRMRDSEPPFLESTVTFRIAPNPAGGTSLRIIHEPTDIRFDRMTRAAANNNNGPIVMLAA
jgi:uncharacterized protein YndB with AHSA1/START domain